MCILKEKQYTSPLQDNCFFARHANEQFILCLFKKASFPYKVLHSISTIRETAVHYGAIYYATEVVYPITVKETDFHILYINTGYSTFTPTEVWIRHIGDSV